MDAVDRYASEAFYLGGVVERLRDQRDALEDALDEAELEIAAWRELVMELLRAQRCSP